MRKGFWKTFAVLPSSMRQLIFYLDIFIVKLSNNVSLFYCTYLLNYRILIRSIVAKLSNYFSCRSVLKIQVSPNVIGPIPNINTGKIFLKFPYPLVLSLNERMIILKDRNKSKVTYRNYYSWNKDYFLIIYGSILMCNKNLFVRGKFLTFNIFLHSKTLPKLKNNWFYRLITLNNPIKKSILIRNILFSIWVDGFMMKYYIFYQKRPLKYY